MSEMETYTTFIASSSFIKPEYKKIIEVLWKKVDCIVEVFDRWSNQTEETIEEGAWVGMRVTHFNGENDMVVMLYIEDDGFHEYSTAKSMGLIKKDESDLWTVQVKATTSEHIKVCKYIESVTEGRIIKQLHCLPVEREPVIF